MPDEKTLHRAFTIHGDVRSPSGWRYDTTSISAALTDLEAINRFRHGVQGMKVRKIEVGGRVIWRCHA